MIPCLRMQKTLVQALQYPLIQLQQKTLLLLQLPHILPTMTRYLHTQKTQAPQQRLVPQPLTKLTQQLLRIRLHLRKLIQLLHLIQCLHMPKTLVQLLHLIQLKRQQYLPIQQLRKILVLLQHSIPRLHTRLILQPQKIHLHLHKLLKAPLPHMILYSLIL